LEKKRVEDEKEYARLERVRKIQEKLLIREKQRVSVSAIKKPKKSDLDRSKEKLFKKHWKNSPD